MLRRKLRNRLCKSKHVIHTYHHERANVGAVKRITRDHLDVLQDIEFGIMPCARYDVIIDDRSIDLVLRTCMNQENLSQDADERAVRLRNRLDRIQAMRDDISEEISNAALRTVH